MYFEHRDELCAQYIEARNHFLNSPDQLIMLEKFITDTVNNTICEHYAEIERDYNEASYMHPFWSKYPPDNRGRAPVGDQIPWIEVGEHAVGHKLSRLISCEYHIQEIGLPSGADNRFVLISPEISDITDGLTDRAFVFLDIKSVGPRDNFDHTVISPYQVSGDGIWDDPAQDMINSPMIATGKHVSHTFYPAISPIYALTGGFVAPTVHVFIKPVYSMLSLSSNGERSGQPLESIKSICVPNGLLLTKEPNYLRQYPGLFFPGKDDKTKDPRKIRVRVSFEILRAIDAWRVTEYEE